MSSSNLLNWELRRTCDLALLKALKALYSSLELISNFNRGYRKKDENEKYPNLQKALDLFPRLKKALNLSSKLYY